MFGYFHESPLHITARLPRAAFEFEISRRPISMQRKQEAIYRSLCSQITRLLPPIRMRAKK